MPGITNHIKLYVATSMDELNNKATINPSHFNTPEKVLKSGETLYQAAEKSYQAGDEEKAYTYFMKYYELYKVLHNKPLWEKTLANNKWINKSKLKEVVKRAEELHQSLEKRYKILKEASEKKNTEVKKLEETSSYESVDSNQNVTASTTTENFVDTSKSKSGDSLSISSGKLFRMMQDSSISMLILDVRSTTDFETSHINRDCCINIAQDLLTPGITAATLEKKLPAEFIPLWKKRSQVDFVIMTDWNSCTPIENGSFLWILRDAVCKWDIDNVLKSEPLILEGGYDDWLLRYPMCTTDCGHINVMRQEESQKTLPDISSLLVDYPNLDDGFLASPDKKETNKLPNSSFQPENGLDIRDNIKSSSIKFIPAVDRSTKPKVETALSIVTGKDESKLCNVKQFLDFNFENEDEQTAQEKFHVPVVDRSSKPLLKGLIHKPMHEKEPAAKEQQYEKLRLQKELEIEESMRIMVQEKEEFLHEKIRALEDENRLLKEGEELKKLKELEVRKEQEKMREVLEKSETIIDNTRKKLTTDKGVEKFREGGSKQENDTKVEEKINIKVVDSSNNDTSKTEQEKEVSTYSTEKGLASEKAEEVYTVPLKYSISTTDVNKRGLTRSHSSPNIAQMIEEEENKVNNVRVPQFDRSLKPIRNRASQSPVYNKNHKCEEIGPARLRNLNPVYGSQGSGITGLKNLGNTCFMNSIIQCLTSTTPLAVFFTSGIFREDINRDNKQGTGGEVAEEFAVVIRAMWMGHYRSIAPKDFKNTVSKYLAVCVGHEQQDSHEFLVVLMEKLHGDLNQAKINRVLRMPDLENLPDYVAAEKFWDYHSLLNESIIKELFEGLLQSTLMCFNCKKTSSNYEVFSCLSLPIPSISKCHLKDCIQLFLKAEKMSGEGAWDCPQCKHRQEAEKKMVICRLPKILIIHLKRFSYEGLWRRKLQTFVNFPMDLDMSNFASTTQLRSYYNLYGVVNHYGTLEGGHYTSYCKNSVYDKWCKYDDHEVSDMIYDDVKTSAAYILFYSSIDLQACLMSKE